MVDLSNFDKPGGTMAKIVEVEGKLLEVAENKDEEGLKEASAVWLDELEDG